MARGHEVVAIPLVAAERVPNPKINLASAQGFLVTASEGARALADTIGVRTFPVFCESEQTAAELRRLGFKLGSGLIVYSQKMTVAAMQMADMKVWAHRS